MLLYNLHDCPSKYKQLCKQNHLQFCSYSASFADLRNQREKKLLGTRTKKEPVNNERPPIFKRTFHWYRCGYSQSTFNTVFSRNFTCFE